MKTKRARAARVHATFSTARNGGRPRLPFGELPIVADVAGCPNHPPWPLETTPNDSNGSCWILASCSWPYHACNLPPSVQEPVTVSPSNSVVTMKPATVDKAPWKQFLAKKDVRL